MEAQILPIEKPFHDSLEKFMALTQELQSSKSRILQLSSLESLVAERGREILRTMLEEHIQLCGSGDVSLSVIGSDKTNRTHRRERAKEVATIFGTVQIQRLIYSLPGVTGLAPKEAMLNLPSTKYSHALGHLLALEAAKGSFDEAQEAVLRQTGVLIPKRQTEELAANAAQDFEVFYEQRAVEGLREVNKEHEFLVFTTDGKGIAMRHEDLREATQKKAEKTKKN